MIDITHHSKALVNLTKKINPSSFYYDLDALKLHINAGSSTVSVIDYNSYTAQPFKSS